MPGLIPGVKSPLNTFTRKGSVFGSLETKLQPRDRSLPRPRRATRWRNSRSAGTMKKGVGVRQNYSEAASWYRQAADQGVLDAMINLGNLYEFGQGVLEDWVQSAKWRQRSAEFGSSGGQSALGDAYQFGIGVPQNRNPAIYWHQQAAAHARRSLGLCYTITIIMPTQQLTRVLLL